MGFLNISDEPEIHTIPKIWEKWIYGESMGKYGESMGKHRDFPYSTLQPRFRVDENPCNSQCLGMYKFP